jgi:ligand-binding sensor domain-containing protein/signal transduction histidine kinase
MIALRGAQGVPNYQIDVWRTDDGLPQGTVTSIVETRDGYLWLGTQNGLVRFDGVNFKVFNQNNTPAIKNNRIVQLFVDRRGALWIGAEQGSLARFQEGKFVGCEMPGGGSAFNYARAFCDDVEGHLWVTSCEWRLMRFAQDGLAMPTVNWTLGGIRPNALAADQAGRVYMGNERELAAWQDGGFQAVWSRTNEPGFEVEFLATSRAGGCWVAGNGRLRRFDSGHWAVDLGTYAWTNQPVYGLYEDTRNRLWVATPGSGLFRYDPDGTRLKLTTRDGLPTDFVRCVAEDREGNIWVGMEGGGLCRLQPSTFQALGVREGLSSDQVMSVCESRDGSYWVGMNGSGLEHLVDGRVEEYGPSQGLMNGHVWSLLQDRQGTIWAGTWGGLFKLDQGRFVNISDGTRVGGVVLAIYEDREGGLWLGQQGIEGVTRLIDGKATTQNITGASSGLDVRAMVEDAGGCIWLGTENEGLYRWKSGQWSHFGKKDGLASESVWSLRADEDGTVWIGTCGGGLSRWRKDHITTWTTKDGLINDVICQILEDGHGNLWLGSYGGVFSVSKSELERPASDGSGNTIHCTGYGKADGLPSIECQGGFQPSGLNSRDGKLWFPTVKGLAIVNPDQLPTNAVTPIVLIEELAVDGSIRTIVSKMSGAEAPANPAGSALKIRPGEKKLEFRYTATSLTAPEKVRFKYRLEGLEQDWVQAGSARAVTYSRLPPGDYQFHVIACNNDGVWNETGDALAVTVLPHFWQTKWFLMASVLASLAAVAGVANSVAARRMRRRIELAERERAVERERRRIAQDMHDDFGAHLTEIALLSEFAQSPDSSPAAVQEDVRKIMTESRALTASLDELVWAVEPANDSLESFVTYACSFAENYLRTARISCRLDLPAQLPSKVVMTEVRHNFFLAFKEGLNNAVKHAHATEVRIHITYDAGVFRVAIRDNGTGFVNETSHDPKAGPQHSGLANMRSRMESIGGQCDLKSAPNQGAELKLTMPLN